MNGSFVDRRDMQRTLFAELSRMFADEVPLYDKSLALNLICNRAVVDLLEARFVGFTATDAQLEATSGERHGAIRIGTDEELRWVSRFFACFGMHPHEFYDLTALGTKSQPVISTAFRSITEPENRVFTSLLRTELFDADTAHQIDTLLAERSVMTEQARTLIMQCEVQGGLNQQDAVALIHEATTRVFKWTGQAHGRVLYESLCEQGFKIAADIACFKSHHLNHLTPNTLCIDLYSAAMKWRLGIIDRSEFEIGAHEALAQLLDMADADWLLLHFRWLSFASTDAMAPEPISTERVREIVRSLTDELDTVPLDLSVLPHNGYKDAIEGPEPGTQVLLRQDAYRALTEPIRFIDENPIHGSVHTARFGEIEQRFYATTPKGRGLYDRWLAGTEAGDVASFPKTCDELIRDGLVYAVFEPGRIELGDLADWAQTATLHELLDVGLLRCRGQRYEDFLPISAAGIFASNLEQSGSAIASLERPRFERSSIETILGREVVDTDSAYRSAELESLRSSLGVIGLSQCDASRLITDFDRSVGRPANAGVSV